MKPRFTIGGMLAAVALVCAYLTTGLYADNPLAQSIASVVNPLLLLVAVIAVFEPGRLGRTFVSVVQWFQERRDV